MQAGGVNQAERKLSENTLRNRRTTDDRFYLPEKKIRTTILPTVVFLSLGGKHHDPCFCIGWHFYGDDCGCDGADHGAILVDRAGELHRRGDVNRRDFSDFCNLCDESSPPQNKRAADARWHPICRTLTRRVPTSVTNWPPILCNALAYRICQMILQIPALRTRSGFCEHCTYFGNTTRSGTAKNF